MSVPPETIDEKAPAGALTPPERGRTSSKGPDMGDYRPYYSRSAVPPKRQRNREYTGWGATLASILDPDDVWFANVYVEAHRIEQYGVEITEDILRNILIKRHEQAMQQTDGAEERAQRPAEVPSGAVVYYMRISDRVKIGTTTSLKRRLIAFNPEELLTTEPGWFELEAQRHRQFAHLRTHGEWFRYEHDLKDHVENLRSQQ
jgi:hypothetical protein